MRKKLFYSPSEKRAFWVSQCHIPDNIDDLISTLKQYKQEFIAHLKNITIQSVYTTTISTSNEYRGHTVFWADNIETCPTDFFEIGHDWTMWKWLK